jgi:outer membrane protein assembly factor BamB
MDARRLVSAFSADDGHQLWQTEISPKDDESRAWGGGIGYDGGIVYVATGFSEVLALDAKDGHVLWRVAMTAPIHSAPTIADGRIYVVTTDAQMLALSTKDGHELWRYTDIAEPALLAGNASPAVSGDVVIAPFPSGDIVALRVQNGSPLWSDNLTVTRHFDAMSTLADIHGAPVIDRGMVFVVGHSGEMLAIDLRTGERAWTQDIGGTSQPWVAGDYLYVLSSSGTLLCLTRAEGRVRWITQLDEREDPTDRKSKPIVWSGPLLAGDRLVVVASNSQAWSVSPYTGMPLGRLDLSGPSFLTPIVGNKTLYILADDGTLSALR